MRSKLTIAAAALFLIGAPAQAERAERDPDKMAVIAATIFIFDRDCEKVSARFTDSVTAIRQGRSAEGAGQLTRRVGAILARERGCAPAEKGGACPRSTSTTNWHEIASGGPPGLAPRSSESGC
jgi:hypothetical protein